MLVPGSSFPSNAHEQCYWVLPTPPHRNFAYIAQMTHFFLWPILSGTLTIRKVKTVYVRLMPPTLCLSIVTPSIEASFEEILVERDTGHVNGY